MNSIVEEKVKGYLRNRLQYDPYKCGAVLFNMRKVARVAGHDLDYRFARAGLAAGPDANVASTIVQRAIGASGGTAVGEHVMKQTVDRWTRTTRSMGM
jgi:hypothetical protein